MPKPTCPNQLFCPTIYGFRALRWQAEARIVPRFVVSRFHGLGFMVFGCMVSGLRVCGFRVSDFGV